jgi:hypothetical protein
MEAPHHRQEKEDEELPVIQLDYAFFSKTGERCKSESAMVAFLVAVDCERGACEATMVQKKGPSDKYACKSIATFLDGLGAKKLVVQGDGEPAMVAVIRKIKQLASCEVIPRKTPRYSSKSNGRVEVTNKIIEGYFRTYKSFVEAQYDTVVGLDSFILPWMIRHAAWTATVFHRQQDGSSAYAKFMAMSIAAVWYHSEKRS